MGIVVFIGLLYALPNLFGEDPAIQISPTRSTTAVDTALQARIVTLLQEAQLPHQRVQFDKAQGQLLVRFADTDTQLKAADLLREKLGRDFTVALNLAAATPRFLQAIGLRPMYLGLDLRGGVHFLLEVDMEAVVRQATDMLVDSTRAALREAKVRYSSVTRVGPEVEIKLNEAEQRELAIKTIRNELSGIEIKEENEVIKIHLSETDIAEKRQFALQQNLTILRNRVNELGVAEPIIQRQGDNRIVVQLPGVQDTARAKDILGATATLEFRLVHEEGDPMQAATTGRVPLNARLYTLRESGQPILLQRNVILTGDYIVHAASGLDPQTGAPQVNISLDSKGARRFEEITKANIGKPMAVVFIENKTETKRVGDELQRVLTTREEVINVATIRDRLGRHFRITGLDSPREARDLALLLRAGALAAPISIIEERTVGPSAGQENITQGFRSAIIGFILIALFMALYYRRFGWLSVAALGINVILIIGALSLLQATLTLPGIAGIVLTMGMAVDANVLIFERIREELRLGNSPQAAIHSGFDRAFGTIVDSNLTTLIAALVLFGFGTGPIKGFAVTLSIGILTTLFSAVWFTRGLVNYVYGSRRLGERGSDQLAI